MPTWTELRLRQALAWRATDGGGASQTQLAVVVLAPADHAPAGEQRARVVVSGSDRSHDPAWVSARDQDGGHLVGRAPRERRRDPLQASQRSI